MLALHHANACDTVFDEVWLKSRYSISLMDLYTAIVAALVPARRFLFFPQHSMVPASRSSFAIAAILASARRGIYALLARAAWACAKIRCSGASCSKRVVVVAVGPMGDVVCAARVIAAVREEVRDVDITVVTKEEHGAVFHAIGGPQVVGLSPAAMNSRYRLWRDTRAVMSGTRTGIMVVLFDRGIPAPALLLGTLGIIGRRIAARTLRCQETLATELVSGFGSWHPYLAPAWLMARAVGCEEASLLHRIVAFHPIRHSSDRDKDKLSVTRAGVAILHPGASSPRKQWPCRYFSMLADSLMESGWRVVLTGSEADGRLVERVSEGMHTIPELAVGLPIEAVSRLLGTAQITVCADTGIGHLAAACGSTVFSVFGPTDPARWAPLGRNVRVVQGDTACLGCAVGDVTACNYVPPPCLVAATPEQLLQEIEGLVTLHTQADSSVYNQGSANLGRRMGN